MPYFKNVRDELFWLDDSDDANRFLPNCVQISEQEFLTLRDERAQAEFAALPYVEKRASEYPSILEYIDGVVKGDQAQIDAYIAACQAVKAKYPKS